MKSYTKYWQKIAIIMIVSGLLLFPRTASAAENIVYEQAPGHIGGYVADGVHVWVADDFQFNQSARIGKITWWGGYASDFGTVDNFTIRLYADNGGQPGALIQVSNVGNAVTRRFTDRSVHQDGRREFEYSFELPTVFFAGANTRYWLSIVNDVPDEHEWEWEQSASLLLPGVQRSFGSDSGPWEPASRNMAFLLHTTLRPTENIVYQQLPNHFGGFASQFSDAIPDSQRVLVADEFQLDQPTLITTITWWASPRPFTADTFTIQLYADNGGEPGAVLRSFDGLDISGTSTGDWVLPPRPDPRPGRDFEGVPEIQYSFDLPTAFLAEANTLYWFSVFIVPAFDEDPWVWEFSSSPLNPGVQRSFDGGPWEPSEFPDNIDNTAFLLQGNEVTPALEVQTDILPGIFPNSIYIKDQGTLPVAILSSSTFDAPSQVDPTSLTFGRSGDEHSSAGCSTFPEDANEDGLFDLVCHFSIPSTGFQLEDTTGTLHGLTFDGQSLTGTDSVELYPFPFEQ